MTFMFKRNKKKYHATKKPVDQQWDQRNQLISRDK